MIFIAAYLYIYLLEISYYNIIIFRRRYCSILNSLVVLVATVSIIIGTVVTCSCTATVDCCIIYLYISSSQQAHCITVCAACQIGADATEELNGKSRDGHGGAALASGMNGRFRDVSKRCGRGTEVLKGAEEAPKY